MGCECHGILERQCTIVHGWKLFVYNIGGWAGAFRAYLFGPCLNFLSTDNCYLSVGYNVLTVNQNGRRLPMAIKPWCSIVCLVEEKLMASWELAFRLLMLIACATFSIYVPTIMSFYLYKLWLMHHRELSILLSVLVPLWKSRMSTIRMSPFLQVYLIRLYLK